MDTNLNIYRITYEVAHSEKEPMNFDNYDPKALFNSLDVQHRTTDDTQKSR